MNFNKYDVIGDIHGHAKVLRNLLGEMGYREEGGVFRHTDRRVIFVGDFIDRGPEQADVLNIARRMCETGTALAVMGNHEFNALGWATRRWKWRLSSTPQRAEPWSAQRVLASDR